VPTLVLYGDSDAALGPQLWKGLDRVVTGAQVSSRLRYQGGRKYLSVLDWLGWRSRECPGWLQTIAASRVRGLNSDQVSAQQHVKCVRMWRQWVGVMAAVSSLQLHCLENCSHWVQQDKPQETNRLMHDFLHSLD
jgi:pimeloyl-ACP methyl ester carboxylesterase